MTKLSKDVFHRIPEDTFRQLIAESTSIRQVFNKMGLCISGDQYKPFRRRIEELDIDLSHFKGSYMSQERFRRELPLDRVFAKDTYHSGRTLARKILKHNLKPHQCVKCGLESTWQDEAITLQLDHENGDNTDNRLENLRFMCPNCHSQTPTFAGRKLKRHYHCAKCGAPRTKEAEHCRRCSSSIPSVRRLLIKWPTLDIIKTSVWEKPLSILAKEWGGSMNGLKKHCKRNNIPYPPMGYWVRLKHGYSTEEALVCQTPVRPKAKRMSDGDIRAAHQLIQGGLTVRQTATTTGFAHTTIARGLKRLGLWSRHLPKGRPKTTL